MNFIFSEVFFKYLFHCTRPWLWHAGSSVFVAACGLFICDVWDLWVMVWELLVVACGIWFPNEGLNQAPHIGSRSLSRWTTREVPHWSIFVIPSLKAFLNNFLLSWFLYFIQFETELFFYWNLDIESIMWLTLMCLLFYVVSSELPWG